MRTIIQLYSFNDYVGYMVNMHKKGYKWADGAPLVPASYAKWDKYGHRGYVRELHKSKEIRWVPSDYVDITLGTTVIPYIEKTNYLGNYDSIKSDPPSEKENQVINRKTYEILVKYQHRMEEDDTKKDDIYHPNHYTSGGIEPIQYIQSHNMNYEKGNVIKYITRAGKKEGESEIKDLKKAQNYIQLLITKLEEKEK